jgi:hypothetical protein
MQSLLVRAIIHHPTELLFLASQTMLWKICRGTHILYCESVNSW